MTTYYRLIHGDCVHVLPTLEASSVDCVVTDPPYGIAFMGKNWDKALPPRKAFQEMWRVLKPGALAFVMSSPRQDVLWRMMSLLESTGFELRQSPLYWAYASGFPKAYDVGKGIDKKLLGQVEYSEGVRKGTTGSVYKEGINVNYQERAKPIPQSEEARRWDGWKSQTGLKPAVEIILQAQKPYSKQQQTYLLLTNLLISFHTDEEKWLKLIALTAQNNSTLDPQSLRGDGENFVHSNAKTSINTRRFNVETVEQYLKWTDQPIESSVPTNVPQPIIQALETRLGREVGSNEKTAISQYMLEMGNTDSNMMLLWRNILVALLLKMSSATTKTMSEMTTELKILNSLLCPNTSLNIIHLNEIIQNGQLFNALTVINAFRSVFLKLKNIPLTSVQKDVTSNLEESTLPVNSVEQYSPLKNSMKILENIAHVNATIKQEQRLEVKVILMANKPRSEKTIVDNVLKHGTGAVNVDACRIPFVSEKDKGNPCRFLGSVRSVERTFGKGGINGDKGMFDPGRKGLIIDHAKGRFPANLLVSDGVLDTGKTRSVRSKRGGVIVTGSERYTWQKGDKQQFDKGEAYECGYDDEGGFSRYFSLDAWFNEKVRKLPKDVQRTMPFLVVPKASKSERDSGLENFELHDRVYDSMGINTEEGIRQRGRNPNNIKKNRNTHPTVKPLALMCYLVTLGCPVGGLVLDPFVGSGTTLVASYLMGKSGIGIEVNEEYSNIADAKMRHYTKRSTEQKGLFTVEYRFEVAT
jgi:DNA modification methylase